MSNEKRGDRRDFLKDTLMMLAAGTVFGRGASAGEAIGFKKILTQDEQQAVEHCLDLIRPCQLASGAFDMRLKRDPKNEDDRKQAVENGEDPNNPNVNTVRVIPYFANHMALALLSAHTHVKESPLDLERAARWGAFYAAKQDPATGYITDFKGARNKGTLVSSGQIDSVDAYASTFLQFAERYQAAAAKQEGPQAKKLDGLLPADTLMKAAQLSLKAIESVMDKDLTWAKPDYKVKFLVDNAEVYGGLLAGADFFKAAGAPAEDRKSRALADRVGRRLEDFWVAEGKQFAWAIMENGYREAGLEKSYPHGLAQTVGLAWCPAGANKDRWDKEKRELWNEINQKFKPDAHNPIERWVMAAIAVQDPGLAAWHDRLVAEAKSFTEATNGHRPAMGLLTVVEGRQWMRSLAAEHSAGKAAGLGM